MRKFKHKITGDIVTKNAINYYFETRGYTTNIPAEVIENSNDWEEIVEKDYEILSFRHKGSNYIWKKDSQLKGLFCLVDGKIPFTSLEEINKYPKVYEIHSIKRLSDGEVFTIGDKIQSKYFIPYNEIRTIQRFKIISNTINVEQDEGITNLNDIKKVKKPLFTTEDGEEIFEEDRFYFVSKDFKCFETMASIRTIQNPDLLFFSSKEAAEEYILMNKPCLSINDIINKVDYNPVESYTSSIRKLKELVKQRL